VRLASTATIRLERPLHRAGLPRAGTTRVVYSAPVASQEVSPLAAPTRAMLTCDSSQNPHNESGLAGVFAGDRERQTTSLRTDEDSTLVEAHSVLNRPGQSPGQ
jgi:hypothetical protein